jgi:hypothetical protein
LAKPNYQFEKQQREMKKKRKQLEKLQRKLDKIGPPPATDPDGRPNQG